MGFRYNRQLRQLRSIRQLNDVAINDKTNDIRSIPIANVVKYRLPLQDYIFLQSIGLTVRNY